MRLDTASLHHELARLDYRKNLAVDPDNPIFVQKACRDRFSGAGHWEKGYGGEAYVGRANGEDALTWNVFRALHADKRLDLLTDFLGLAQPTGVLFWGCAVDSWSYELQSTLNGLIRLVDGRCRGPLTECDLVVETAAEVAVIEVKVSHQGVFRAQSDGSETRWNVYRSLLPEAIASELPQDGWQPYYQLWRSRIYSLLLADVLRKKSRVFALVPRAIHHGESADTSIPAEFVYWEDLEAYLGTEGKASLADRIRLSLLNARTAR